MPDRFFRLLLLSALLLGPSAARSATHIADIDSILQPFVEQREIAGAVTLVARDGEVRHLSAVGEADVATRRAQRVDDLFWIASMTKPMAAVCILMLEDEGRLSVDDPVQEHLPEFKGQWLVASKTAGEIELKRPARPITIRDLLTHTSGLPSADEPRAHSTLAELVAQNSQLPLEFEPGSRWQYSNGGINTLGRIVEVVSGQEFSAFLQDRLLRPLGMKDTTFFPSRAQTRRVAKSYERDPATGQLKEVSVYFVRGELWDRERTVKPAGGLYSTAEDIRRFYQLMLDGGVWRGKRLLSERAVGELTRTQTGDIKTGFTDGMSWGFGFQVVKEPQGVTAMLHPGTFGHGGAYGTQSWADPVTRTVYILMIQRRGFPNGDNSEVRKAFQATAAAALGTH